MFICTKASLTPCVWYIVCVDLVSPMMLMRNDGAEGVLFTITAPVIQKRREKTQRAKHSKCSTRSIFNCISHHFFLLLINIYVVRIHTLMFVPTVPRQETTTKNTKKKRERLRELNHRAVSLALRWLIDGISNSFQSLVVVYKSWRFFCVWEFQDGSLRSNLIV